jgi:hypothetical protein
MRWLVLALEALVGLVGAVSAVAADRPTAVSPAQRQAGVQLTLSPPAPTRKQRVLITVTGTDSSAVSVAVRLVGATSRNGRASPTMPLMRFAEVGGAF